VGDAIKLAEFEYDGEERLLVTGPDLSGNLMELVAVPVAGGQRASSTQTGYARSSTPRCEGGERR
jgi:hypothetical protein